MEQDEIISRAIRIVKNNNKYYKSVISITSVPEKYDFYFVKTDQKDFYVENSENYRIDEIKEIFEKKILY